eukprot:GHVQ01006628.1.p1 GENE.GHVQ01006628.1~~GHVQ01006628.1.p1  ORF type:complete len:401 (-),score=53.05 GHVQ01006628.1:610-1812(-)
MSGPFPLCTSQPRRGQRPAVLLLLCIHCLVGALLLVGLSSAALHVEASLAGLKESSLDLQDITSRDCHRSFSSPASVMNSSVFVKDRALLLRSDSDSNTVTQGFGKSSDSNTVTPDTDSPPSSTLSLFFHMPAERPSVVKPLLLMRLLPVVVVVFMIALFEEFIDVRVRPALMPLYAGFFTSLIHKFFPSPGLAKLTRGSMLIDFFFTMAIFYVCHRLKYLLAPTLRLICGSVHDEGVRLDQQCELQVGDELEKFSVVVKRAYRLYNREWTDVGLGEAMMEKIIMQSKYEYKDVDGKQVLWVTPPEELMKECNCFSEEYKWSMRMVITGNKHVEGEVRQLMVLFFPYLSRCFKDKGSEVTERPQLSRFPSQGGLVECVSLSEIEDATRLGRMHGVLQNIK